MHLFKSDNTDKFERNTWSITWSLMSFLALLPSSPSLSPASTVSSIDAATDSSPFFLDLNNECGFFEIRTMVTSEGGARTLSTTYLLYRSLGSCHRRVSPNKNNVVASEIWNSAVAVYGTIYLLHVVSTMLDSH